MDNKLECVICSENNTVFRIFNCSHHMACFMCIFKNLSVNIVSSGEEDEKKGDHNLLGSRSCPECRSEKSRYSFNSFNVNNIPKQISDILYKDTKIECPTGCGLKSSYVDIDNHIENCEQLTISCPYCDENFPYRSNKGFNLHLDDCKTIPCNRLTCSAKGTREFLKLHNLEHLEVDRFKRILSSMSSMDMTHTLFTSVDSDTNQINLDQYNRNRQYRESIIRSINAYEEYLHSHNHNIFATPPVRRRVSFTRSFTDREEYDAHIQPPLNFVRTVASNSVGISDVIRNNRANDQVLPGEEYHSEASRMIMDNDGNELSPIPFANDD